MPRLEPHAWTFEAIGTSWQLDTAERLAPAAAGAVEHRIEQFDQTWSRFRPDSVVSQIAAEAGSWELPPEAGRLLDLYRVLHQDSDGAVTPLVGQALSDLGYDAGYSLRPRRRPAAVPAWDVLRWEPPVLTTTSPVLLDIGAAGKGCLVDLVAAVLVEHDVRTFTIDASGDMLHRGAEPLRVALEHPGDPTRAIGIAEIGDGFALCASATNRRAWGDDLHHVLDGRTGRPARDVTATWVVADSCMVADGLATALFFAEPLRLASRFAHAYVRMHADGRVEWSDNFPGEVFT